AGELANALVVRVGDVQVAIGCDLDAVRPIELRGFGRAAVAAEAAHAGAGEGVDGAVRLHDADGVVHGVGDVQRAVRRDGDVARRVELRLCRRTAVSRVTRCPGANDGGDIADLVDEPHLMVASIGDVDAVVRIDRDAARRRGRLPLRAVELGLYGRTAVACAARHAGAGDGVDDAVRLELAQPVIGLVGDDDVAD